MVMRMKNEKKTKKKEMKKGDVWEILMDFVFLLRVNSLLKA